MARITGIGGVFFKAVDPKSLAVWYHDVLGLEVEKGGAVNFAWSDDPRQDAGGHTVWAPFENRTDYFGPSDKPFMINFRVDDLDGVLTRLREAGAVVMEDIQAMEYGRFGWFVDPEGNKVELWEPAGAAPY